MMNRFLRFALMLTLVVVLSIGTSAQAYAFTYSPPAGAKFNDPTGTVTQQYAILDHIRRSIDNAPSGSIIRIATYAIDNGPTVDKLIAAHKRGAHVKVIYESHMANSYTQKLVTALGTNKTSRSFAVTCRASCLGPSGDLHAKMYLFSTAGYASRVTMIGSANLTTKNAVTGWNNLYTTVGDTALYDYYRNRFTQMLSDANVANAYMALQSGSTAAYLYPKPITQAFYDPILAELNRVSCSGVQGPYGSSGHTVVHVAMFGWMNTRADIARKLWELDNAGCVVDVVVDYNLYKPNDNSGHIQDAILPILMKPTANGGIPIYDGHYDSDGNGFANYYMHNKYLLINGRYGSSMGGTAVFTGSQNWSYASLYQNNEILNRIFDVNVYRSYAGNFLDLKRNAHRMTTPDPYANLLSPLSYEPINGAKAKEATALDQE